MSSIDANEIPELDRGGLRRFGMITGAALVVLFGIVLPLVFARPLPHWPWIGGGVLVSWAVLAPLSLRPVYRGWTRFGLTLNKITNPIILGLVFVVAVTPVALLFKVVGRDTMSRKFKTNAPSYRVPSAPISKDDMKRPF